MRLIDEHYTACPFYGSRRMTAWLTRQGHLVNRKRVRRLMGLTGLEAIYPRPKLSAGGGHKVHPYLLRGVSVERPDQVWSAPASSCFFQPWIRVGWAPYWPAGSLTVRSPLRAARATCALNAVEV
jgi:putative transposase